MSKTKTKLRVKPDERLDLPSNEDRVLDYWDEINAFEQSLDQRQDAPKYVFYDGPPFATGTPHYGHLLASTIKDLIPRYQTMKGYRVDRVWGWDCHGLPIENIVEKELDLKGGKKAIEEMGIDKFNQACRSAIWRFDKHWEQVIRRLGRWVDFKNSYKTMDTTFMESVWWAFQKMNQKGLVYQGRKVILYCPRCATPLSNFEIAMDNSYKELSSPSTTYKYKLKSKPNTYLLAWSTTPWNKLATPALAVNPDLTYVEVEQAGENYILVKSRLEAMLKTETEYRVKAEFKGSQLDEQEFELHYDFYPERQGKRAGVVVADEYVSDEEGTGVVTLAVYGEDDYRVMLDKNIQLVEHVDDNGHIKSEVEPFAGMFMLKANKLVDKDLMSRGLIYHTEDRVHRVPVCYRCETRLYQAPLPAWFINIQKIKSKLIENNQSISWYPEHLKEGRFKKGLETAPDWNISRSRYWGTPIPVWRSQDGKQTRIIGSIEELKKWAVDPNQVKDLTDIHREFVDDIQVWVDDKKSVKGRRIPEVFDCWVESGSMPFAAIHYPFENEQEFENNYPAQFISEYIAQTRAWFYTLHVISTAIFDSHTFEHALTTGTILAEDGTKMSKSKKNYPDPTQIFSDYGVDALRLYLMGSVVMRGDNLNFSEREVKEYRNKYLNPLWNSVNFLRLYADEFVPDLDKPIDCLDRWIVSRTQSLIEVSTENLDNYDTVAYVRQLQRFVTDLSTWYLRLSRDRLRDDKATQNLFAWVIHQFALVSAPVTPFISETIYHNLSGEKASVHLEDWPKFNSKLQDKKLEEQMKIVRKVVEALHATRQKHGIKVRQPLALWSVDEAHAGLLAQNPELIKLINLETNIENFAPLDSQWYSPEAETNTVVSNSGAVTQLGDLTVYVDTEITPELAAAGQARELVRQVQQQRKKLKIDFDAQVEVGLPDWPESESEYIQEKTLATKLYKAESIEVKPVD